MIHTKRSMKNKYLYEVYWMIYEKDVSMKHTEWYMIEIKRSMIAKRSIDVYILRYLWSIPKDLWRIFKDLWRTFKDLWRIKKDGMKTNRNYSSWLQKTTNRQNKELRVWFMMIRTQSVWLKTATHKYVQ